MTGALDACHNIRTTTIGDEAAVERVERVGDRRDSRTSES